MGSVIGNVVLDLSKSYNGSFEEALRPDWIGRDVRHLPEAVEIFARFGEPVETDRPVLHCTNPEHDFSLIVGAGPEAKMPYPNPMLRGRSDIRVIVLGRKLLLHTDDLMKGVWENIPHKKGKRLARELTPAWVFDDR